MPDIRGFVNRLCRRYGTHDPFALCEAMSIGVLYCDLPAEVKGFYLKFDASKVIFLNQDLEEPDARFVCGHELGHAVLHSDYNVFFLQEQTLFNCQRYENEADLFSAYLLLCGEDWEGTEDETVTVEELACRTGIPQKTLEMWLEQNTLLLR